MKFNLYPKKVTAMFAGMLIITVLSLFIASYALQIYRPDDSVTDAVIQWRFIVIPAYGLFCYFAFYAIGILGSFCTMDYDGITIKRGFKTTLIPWDTIEKIYIPNPTENYIRISISKNYNKENPSTLMPEYTIANSTDAKNQIEEYWQDSNIVTH